VDDTLKKLTSYLACKDSRLACAAAVLVTELAPRDPAIVKQLTAALDVPDGVRKQFLIEALGRIGTPEASAALVPLIKSDGPSSEQALRAIAHAPGAALKPLLKMLGTVPPALLERVAECVARTGESSAFSGLLDTLRTAETDACRAIRAGMRVAMTGFEPKAKEHLYEQLDIAFRDKAYVKHQPALIAAMKIGGDLGDVRLSSFLVARVEEEYPVIVRRSALHALAMLHFNAQQRAKLAPKLLPLMLEADLTNLAEPALDALRAAQLGIEHHPHLRKLLNSSSSRIREFAMQALAQQGTSRTLHELIACLESADRSVREEALGALSRAPQAAGALAERLISLKEPAAIIETARALAPQASKIPPKLLGSLAEQYIGIATQNGSKKPDPVLQARAEEKRRAILSIFRTAQSPELVHAVVQKAHRLRNDGTGHAYQMLKEVAGLNGWNDDAKLEMATIGLQKGPKDLARTARSNDSNLHSLQDIVASARRPAKDFARALVKEDYLDRRTLHYIGFHFVERIAHEREFGRLILETLAEGRSEEGKLAREKLILEGLIAMKPGRTGILEERAKVMLSASDFVTAKKAKKPAPAAKKKVAPPKKAAPVKAKAAKKSAPKPAKKSKR